MTRTAAVVAGLIMLVAVVGPLVADVVSGYGPTEQIGLPFDVPSAAHPLGTDALGRDVVSRLLDGGAAVVGLAATATLVTGVVGLLVGVVAGTAPQRTGEVVVRVVDVLAVVPPLLIVLVLAAGFPGGDGAILAAVVLVSLPFSVRVNRSAVDRVAHAGYVEIARARGDGWWRVLRHDILPAVLPTTAAETGLRFVAAVQLAATAGFLGLGAGPPAANWGRMVAENLPGAALSPWPFLAPALVLVALAVAVNVLAEALTRPSARRRSGRSRPSKEQIDA
ncbi:ABC transporter permease [Pseudonocardia sp. RS010]|uniref:ABC transporter permease n=1 Tax=Pseudonocardia sp. RS010 TaxID=3385979 RepID=UPI0039A11D8B